MSLSQFQVVWSLLLHIASEEAGSGFTGTIFSWKTVRITTWFPDLLKAPILPWKFSHACLKVALTKKKKNKFRKCVFRKLQLVYFGSWRACRLLSQFSDPSNGRLVLLTATSWLKYINCIFAFYPSSCAIQLSPPFTFPCTLIVQKMHVADVKWHSGSVRALFGYIYGWSSKNNLEPERCDWDLP